MARTDFDSGWKEIIEEYFPEFLEFFFPRIFVDIDFQKGHEFLDKELLEIVKDNELGKRFADKLVKVFLKNGHEQWLLIHLEVQGQYDISFARRMYVYNYRIFDKFDKEVISLAILADESPNFRPRKFQIKRWDFILDFQFPAVKLLDFKSRIKDLGKSKTPFAVAVLAHLKMMDAGKDDEKKLFWKISLVKNLFQAGFEKSDIRNLYRFIDWIGSLPKEFELKFRDEIYKENKKMPYITSLERLAKEEGIQQGIQQGMQQAKLEGLYRMIEFGLKLKFRIEGLKLLPEIKKIKETGLLETIVSGIEEAKNPEELRKIYKPEKNIAKSETSTRKSGKLERKNTSL